MTPSRRHLFLAAIATCAALLTLLPACGDDKGDDSGDAFLALTISPTQIPADGTTADISVTANKSDSKLGTGEVTFSAATGAFNGGGTEYTADLSNGHASVSYACDARVHESCEGQQRITATWNGLQRQKILQVVPLSFSLELAAAKAKVYPARESHVIVTARISEATNAQNAATQALRFTTTLGRLSADEEGAEFEDAPVIVANDEGIARVRLYPDNSIGEAQVTVEHEASQTSATAAVQFARNAITATATPKTLFVDTGDAATIAISLRDNEDAPISNQLIRLNTTLGSFSASANGADTTAVVTTDAEGNATAQLHEKGAAGTATISLVHEESAAEASVVVEILKRGLSIAASETEIFSGSQTPVLVTATLLDDANRPIAGAELTFTTALGLLSANVDGASQSANLTISTDGMGKAVARFYANDAQGTATITVTQPESNISDSVQIALLSQSLTLSAASQALYSGETALVTATLSDAEGKPISGQKITFSATLGGMTSVAQDIAVSTAIDVATDAAGKAQARFVAGSSDGTAIITALQADYGLSRQVSITIGSNALELSSGRDSIFYGVKDAVVLSATLKSSATGAILPFEPIDFSTTLGGFTAMDAGTDATADSITVNTDANGVARVRFTQLESQAQQTGVATVTARHEASGVMSTREIEFVTVNQISHHATTCNGDPCTLMGIRGSGFNEQALVTFIIRDSQGNPAANVPVSFSISNPPTGTTVSGAGVSDAQGLVSANVTSGQVIGVFNVQAKVTEVISTRSANIGIRGITPSNRNFTFQCSPVNQTVYTTPYLDQPADTIFPCKVKLSDRYGNPIGISTPIQFKTEAGSIPNAASTTPYEIGGDNTEEGAALVNFNTWGGPAAPRDVEPLAADGAQKPNARLAEPFSTDGLAVRNPRDGLVTLIAYVRGEEFFHDLNGNGIWDEGEPFYDQGEPFVDANDNGTWDKDELFVDVNNDGTWNGPNGSYDADTTIWTLTHVLYTGYVARAALRWSAGEEFTSLPNLYENPDRDNVPVSYGQWKGTGEGCLDYNSADSLVAYFADRNLNRVQADHAFTALTDNGTLDVKSYDAIGMDGFGFGLHLGWFDGAGNSCNVEKTDSVCTQQVRFISWEQGRTGTIHYTNNADAPDEEGGKKTKSDLLRAEMTVQGLTISLGLGDCTMK